MNPRVSIIMGSTSDLAIMEKAAKVLDDMGIPFEMNALSAHRTPAEVEAFAKQAAGIPVATVAINGAMNAGILAVQILAVGDRELKEKMIHFKESLKKKIVDANKELAAVKYNFKTN